MQRFARSDVLRAALFLLVSVGWAVAAFADTIRITSGTMNFGVTTGQLSISGDGGFAMWTTMDVAGGIYAPWERCGPPVCGPGSIIPLTAGWSGNDLPGVATFDGQVYPLLGSFNVPQAAVVEFFGTAVAPPLEVGSTAVVTAPFTFQGLFFQPIEPGPFAQTVRHDLVGGGTTTLWLERNFGGTTWRPVASRYEFEPVPEPATLALVGSGVVMALARRRFRSWRR